MHLTTVYHGTPAIGNVKQVRVSRPGVTADSSSSQVYQAQCVSSPCAKHQRCHCFLTGYWSTRECYFQGILLPCYQLGAPVSTQQHCIALHEAALLSGHDATSHGVANTLKEEPPRGWPQIWRHTGPQCSTSHALHAEVLYVCLCRWESSGKWRWSLITL